LNNDLVTGDEADIEEELRRVVEILERALKSSPLRRGYGWGACMSLAIIEYFRDRGYREELIETDGVSQVVGDVFRAARLAMRDEILKAESDGRLRRPRRKGSRRGR
jgi:hypothetical protein